MKMNVVWKRTRTTCVAIAIAIGASTIAIAQDHDHGSATLSGPVTPEQQRRINKLVSEVRDATQRFKDVHVAEAAGYALGFGCVSGSGEEGAMGLHFINGGRVADGVIKVDEPEIILYEPLPNGEVRITGADYLVDAATWDAANPGPPQLEGQLFHFFDAPNRFGLKPFYTLHVWAWKDNPSGPFTNWNPNVSCEAFNGTVR
jgi:hypothetical protein